MSYIWQALVVPLPISIIGAVSGLLMTLKWPWLASYRIGATGNVIQMISTIPAVALLLFATFHPLASTDGSLLRVLAVGICVAVGLFCIIAARIRGETLIGSTHT